MSASRWLLLFVASVLVGAWAWHHVHTYGSHADTAALVLCSVAAAVAGVGAWEQRR